MTKIVYNSAFGGAGLSDKAIKRYAELRGIQLYQVTAEEETLDPRSLLCLGIIDNSYYLLCPPSAYDAMVEANDPNAPNMFFSEYDILANRSDPILVQVIEELGSEANGWHADLKIKELAKGTKYVIHEYDGCETVMTPDDYDWKIA